MIIPKQLGFLKQESHDKATGRLWHAGTSRGIQHLGRARALVEGCFRRRRAQGLAQIAAATKIEEQQQEKSRVSAEPTAQPPTWNLSGVRQGLSHSHCVLNTVPSAHVCMPLPCFRSRLHWPVYTSPLVQVFVP